MTLALALAREAYDDGEIPVGCVVTRGREVVGRGRNRRENEQNALLHAELVAIAEACRTLNSWRLDDCSLYVTLEPCPMCAGALFNAKIPRLYYGARDPKAGAVSSVLRLFEYPLPHKLAITPDILADESAALLRAFFQRLR